LGVVKWNEGITEGLYNGSWSSFFLDNEVPAEHIIRWNVPVLNLFMAKKMLQTQNVDAIIVIGCVIQGETFWFCVRRCYTKD
jgi:6,7-dimethyl-8-ribityllumazine synthase